MRNIRTPGEQESWNDGFERGQFMAHEELNSHRAARKLAESWSGVFFVWAVLATVAALLIWIFK